MNPVIPVLERRAKYGETMTEPQILDDISSWFYVDADKAFQDAIKEGLIVKDGKNPFGEDLWILPNYPIKKPSAAEMAADEAYVQKVMAEAVAYAKKPVAEQMPLDTKPPTKIGHNA